MAIRKTKIVATIGPASEDEETLVKLLKAGVNVVRFNFSHGNHAIHEARLKEVRSAAKKTGISIAILQDLSGPKMRTGDLKSDTVILQRGATVTFVTEKIVGDALKMSISYRNLPREVKKGTHILLDDGAKKLKVIAKGKTWIKCKVVIGGEIAARRGVNVPGTSLGMNSLTTKDKKDLLFAIKHNIDFVALSFVRTAHDIQNVKKFLAKRRADINIIAKIETQDALNNIDEIIAEADGVMIARGDLAVEVPAEEVPIEQRSIIEKCNVSGKPVIVATQMLESMIHSAVPTRAEVGDIANSIFEGADAIMLSAESAIGKYPVQVVETMSRVARRSEAGFPYADILAESLVEAKNIGTVHIDDAISHYVVNTAYDIGATVIVALTESGFTARMIARYRPQQPIIVMSPNKKTLGRIILTYGCYPQEITQFKYVGEAIERIKKIVVKEKFAKRGDKLVISAGVPFGKAGGTNMILVHKI